MFLGAAAGGILVMFLNFDGEVSMFKSELRKTISYYRTDDRVAVTTLFWDNVQPNLECCGADTWRDWEQLDKLNSGMQIPGKCCKPHHDDCTYNPSTDTAYLEVREAQMYK